MLSEICLTEKDKYHMISKQMNKQNKNTLKETETKAMVVRGGEWGAGEQGEGENSYNIVISLHVAATRISGVITL